MTVTFERPIGASADVAELEFISALHQTELNPRQDASIKAIDIVYFLSSRYGIRVSEDEVKETVLCGLGGGDDSEYIDVLEVVSILIIPELIKASKLLFERPEMERDRSEFDHVWEFDDYRRRYSILKKNQPDTQMIERVLEMILRDTTGSELPKPLDRQLVKDIFTAYGEEALVENDEMVDEMIVAASSGKDDGKGSFLDVRAFARALTSDVQRYDVNNETKLSTHYHDVFDTYKSTKETPHWSDHLSAFSTKKLGSTLPNGETGHENGMADEECAESNPDDVDTRPVERFFTFPSIDYVAGTYSSKSFVVTLWVCGVVTYFAYLWDFDVSFGRLNCTVEYDDNMVPTNRGQYFGCRMANGLINWIIIMLELSILGSSFICFGSIGNSVFDTSPFMIFLGMAFVTLFTILPFAVEVKTPFFETVHSAEAHYQFIYYCSLILGCVLLITQLFLLVKRVVPEEYLMRHRRLARLIVPGIVFAESDIKQAASLKMSRLLRNALDIHCLPSGNDSTNYVTGLAETSYGRALLSFNNIDAEFDTTGGVIWAWKGILSGRLQREEGIFLNSQIVAGNIAQIIVCLFVLIAGIVLLVNEVNREPSEDPSVGAYAPERWMVVLSVLIAIFSGLIAGVSIFIKYIPSTVSTTLQYRSGVLPTLRDKDFWIYRVAEDQITLLFGSIFWGTLYTTFAIGVFFGLIVFVAVWQITREIFLHFFANVVGILVTLLLKILVLRLLRRSWYASFYRKQPLKANMLNVILQCWNVALTTGYMLVRGLMLLLATMLFMGRIDKPFLAAESARVGGLHLDSYPIAFRKTLLMNEAHRHPYIERLGFMYMYKLRYGEGFAKTSGSIWRLLFASVLFPWLRKYRIQANPKLKDVGDKEADKLSRAGTFRVLPKPSPRYGSLIEQSKDLPAAEESAKETEMLPTKTEEQLNDDSNGAPQNQDPLVRSDDTVTSALESEIKDLKRQNMELLEKIALMKGERIP